MNKKVSDSMKSIHDSMSPLGRQLEGMRALGNSPAMEAIRRMNEPTALGSLMKDMNRYAEMNERMMRPFRGAIAELHLNGTLGRMVSDQTTISKLIQGLGAYNQRFSLPTGSLAVELAKTVSVAPELKAYRRALTGFDSKVLDAVRLMHRPWLDKSNGIHSAMAFAKLTGVGQVIAKQNGFATSAAELVRQALGDWRDPIAWPSVNVNDIEARSSLYEEHGLDPTLTDFPLETFEEATDLTGLRAEPQPLVAAYNPPIDFSHDEEQEAAFARSLQAYDWLLRLETQLRRFIDAKMSLAAGPDWPRHRTPQGMYDKWNEKKQKVEAGRTDSWPLIAYADFTDYQPIICRKDNWRDVFKPIFLRPESVLESFQRLYPFRLGTMHARPISQDDELMLYVEVNRLGKIIWI